MQKIWLIILSTLVFSITAEESKTEQTSDNSIEFYAGISLGWDHLIAKRNEQVVTTQGNNRIFSDNKPQTANGVTGKVVTGFFWNIPNSSFALSPEIYLGQGSVEITKKESIYDPVQNATKELQSTLRQRLTMGVILRAGYYLTNNQNNFLYVLIGADQSKFENKFVLTSTDPLGGNHPLFEKRSKYLRSPVIGFGFERKFNKFKVGIDIRYMNYEAWGKYSQKAPDTSDVISIKFKPRIISTALTVCYFF
ncbi:MAG: hypothetical protein WCN27_00575 [Alphaproteobacteria bacterium]